MKTNTLKNLRTEFNMLRNNHMIKMLILAFVSVWALMLTFGLSARNIFLPIAFIFLTYFYSKSTSILQDASILSADGHERPQDAGSQDFQTKKCPITAADVVSFLMASAVLFAVHKEIEADYTSKLFSAVSLTVVWVGWLIIARAAVKLITGIYAQHSMEGYLLQSDASVDAKSTHKTFVKAFLICLICYLPYFLFEYPGIMSPDSINQIGQVMGLYELSNHHPLAHTFLIYIFYKIGHLFTSDVNVAISFYTLAQMIFMCLCYAKCVETLKRLGFRKRVYALALAFFALVPFNAIFAVTIWKDVPYAGVVLLLTCQIALVVAGHGPTIKTYLTLWILLFAMSLLRSNGFYACIVMIPVLLIISKKYRKQIVVIGFSALVVAWFMRGPLIEMRGYDNGDFIESASIPLQQITRVVVDDVPISDEDRALIENVIDTTYIKILYAPDFADNMKELVRAGNQGYITANKGKFLSLWIRLGLKYTGIYLQSWVDMTKGYWYPDMEMWTGGISGIMDNELGLYPMYLIRGSVVVKLRELAYKLGQTLPIYGLLFSPGVYTWLMIIGIMLVMSQKTGRKRVVISLPALFTLLTILIATPATDFRYAYALVVSIPILMVMPFIQEATKQ